MTYTYTRSILGDNYDINQNGLLSLPEKIEQVFNFSCNMVCYENECYLTFERGLTEAEKTTLDAVVLNYKNGVV